MRRLAAAALLAGSIGAAAPAETDAGDAATATDANLVTALDVSDSIMRHEEWIQFAGMIHALQSDDFLDAAIAGPHGRIGFAVIVWSSAAQPDVIVPWTLIGSKQDARRVVDRLAAARRQYGFEARMGNGQSVAAYRGDGGGSAAPAHRTDVSTAHRRGADEAFQHRPAAQPGVGDLDQRAVGRPVGADVVAVADRDRRVVLIERSHAACLQKRADPWPPAAGSGDP